MQENDTDTSVANEEVVDTEVDSLEETTETADVEESPAQLKARLQRAEKKIEKMKLDAKVEKKVEQKVQEKTADGLDETQLDYLDLKGITEDEDVAVIESIVKKTGLTVRQALKDDYVVSKLAANKASREVKDATPSATRRTGGNQGTDLSALIARYEQSGFDAKTLPDDFATRAKVINAVTEKQSTNKPAWHQ